MEVLVASLDFNDDGEIDLAEVEAALRRLSDSVQVKGGREREPGERDGRDRWERETEERDRGARRERDTGERHGGETRGRDTGGRQGEGGGQIIPILQGSLLTDLEPASLASSVLLARAPRIAAGNNLCWQESWQEAAGKQQASRQETSLLPL